MTHCSTVWNSFTTLGILSLLFILSSPLKPLPIADVFLSEYFPDYLSCGAQSGAFSFLWVGFPAPYYACKVPPCLTIDGELISFQASIYYMIPVYLFILPPKGHLDCLQAWSFADDVAINTYVQMTM